MCISKLQAAAGLHRRREGSREKRREAEKSGGKQRKAEGSGGKQREAQGGRRKQRETQRSGGKRRGHSSADGKFFPNLATLSSQSGVLSSVDGMLFQTLPLWSTPCYAAFVKRYSLPTAKYTKAAPFRASGPAHMDHGWTTAGPRLNPHEKLGSWSHSRGLNI